MERLVECPAEAVEAGTIGSALARYFARHPLVRGYVLDEQGSVRKHVVIFLDGQPLQDRRHLADPVKDGSTVLVMQALSGG